MAAAMKTASATQRGHKPPSRIPDQYMQPTTTGTGDFARTASSRAPRSLGSCLRAPVTPATETK